MLSKAFPGTTSPRTGPDGAQPPILRVGLRALASNQLPAVLADIADDAGDTRGATQARWMATAAKASRGQPVPRRGASADLAPDVLYRCGVTAQT